MRLRELERPAATGVAVEALPRPAGRAHEARAPGQGTAAVLLGRALAVLAVLGLVAFAVVLRRPGYLLEHGFWLDESWVVDAVRAPLGQLGLMTSSTPLGWTLLLRLVPAIGDAERYRLLPLAFGVASVLPAWWLGGRLAASGWRRRLGAAVVALAVAAAPAALARHDLKQYTADVLATLTIALLTALVEEGWTGTPGAGQARSRSWWRGRGARGSLAVFALGCLVLVPVSHAALFALAAALAALAAGRLWARDWRRLGRLAVTALPLAVGAACWYLLTVAPGNNAQLRDWWANEFVPLDRGLGAAASFAGDRLAAVLERAGFGPWPVALGLAALGVAGFWLAGRRAVALYLPVLIAGQVVAGTLQLYPLMEARTSLFASVLLTAYAAAGVVTAAFAAIALARAGGGRRAPAGVGAGPAAAFRRVTVGALGGLVVAELVVAGAAALAPAAVDSAAARMPESGVRGQVEFILQHRRPGDVVVVNWSAQFGFAHYWPDQPTFAETDAATAVRFRVAYPDRGDILVVHRDDWALARQTLAAAVLGGASRVWIVVAHGGPAGDAAWRDAASGLGTISSPAGQAHPYLLTPIAGRAAGGQGVASRGDRRRRPTEVTGRRNRGA